MDALSLYYPAAIAAYNPDTIPVGNGYSVTAKIGIEESKTDRLIGEHIPLLWHKLTLDPVFGFVAKRSGSVLVGIRGTRTALEWLADATILRESCQMGVGTVHQGFSRVYDCIRRPLMEAVASVWESGDAIHITGHSLGAALAQLFALDAETITNDVHVCTFGGPKVGFSDFVAMYERRISHTLRVVNKYDPVPRLPLPTLLFPFRHAGEELEIRGTFKFDPHFRHSLVDSYLPGLEALRTL